MSGIKIEMSGNWERELNKMVQGAMHDIAADYQKMFDRIGRQYKGRPVSEIKPALQREWSRIGGSITDPELTDYATLISEGTNIKMQVGR